MLRLVLICLCILGISAISAAPNTHAQPSDVNSFVPTCLTLTPDGSAPYTVTVNDVSNNPVANAIVTVAINPLGLPFLCICSNMPQDDLVFTAVTNSQGVANFFLTGGGCVNPPALPTSPVTVSVQTCATCPSIPLRPSPNVTAWIAINSPDVYTFPQPPCAVGLSDAITHTINLNLQTPNPCSDFTPPYGDLLNLGDAVFITPYVVNAVTCQ